MNTLRPDEIASHSRIEKTKQEDRNLKTGAKTLAGITGAGLGSRIAPFLSELIPIDLAIKGINKISPKLGEALNEGMKKGLNIKDGLNFVRENLMGQSEKKEPPKENRNIIEQYSPELFQFLNGEIQNGRAPLEAGALAQSLGKFSKEIKSLEKDHRSPFSAILQTVFGEGEGMQARQAPQQPQQGQPQPQGQGAGSQALMAAIEKLRQLKSG